MATGLQKAQPDILALFSPAQRANLEEIQAGIDSVAGEIEMLTVATREDAANLNNLLGSVKTALATIDHARTAQVKPLNDTVRAINDVWKKPTTRLEETEKVAKRKLLIWTQAERERQARAQEAARKAQEEAAQREAEARAKAERAKSAKAREAALAEAEAANQALALARDAEPIGEPTHGVKSDGGDETVARVTSSIRTVWRFQLMDKARVPQQFLALDEKAVRRAIAEGARDIPGLSIYEEEEISTRLS